ncbi:hypothetical protein R6Q59_026533 [Mikania micrantha]
MIFLTRFYCQDRAPYPPSPLDEDSIVETESDVLLHVVYPMVSNEDESPLLKRSTLDESQAINLRIDFSSVELGCGI